VVEPTLTTQDPVRQEGARMAGDASGHRIPVGRSVPAGVGHMFSALEDASAWASLIPPPGWTPERTAALARQPAG
jgi:hypothetical protein